ncbi:CD63 antigen-like [Haematobia irritans]|uniref:CD63 antigen-like n=1 Tax=Haematobia irritans TaxID=7368 RepID=UPI003F4F9141
MDCGAKLTKYLLFIFNTVFMLCGILLAIVGSLLIKGVDKSTYLSGSILPMAIISVGCITFVIAFFGCCGSVRESRWCITIYAFSMFIVLCLQITLLTFLFVKQDEIVVNVERVATAVWNRNTKENGYPMNNLQMEMNCCGLTSYKDYENTSVPSTCCGIQTGQCEADIYMHKNGCRSKLVKLWTSNVHKIRCACIAMAVIEFFGLFLACYFKNNIHRSDHPYIYGSKY